MKCLSTIFFSIAVFCLSTICVSAQNTTLLENTEWGATTADYYTSFIPPPVTVLYNFEKQGKAKVLVSFVYAPAPQTTFDPVTGQWKTQVYSPTIKSVSDFNGRYTPSDSSIRIEFSDHIINATIKDNRMVGEVTSKKSNKKFKWSAEKISGGSSNQSISTNSSPASIDLYISPTRSKLCLYREDPITGIRSYYSDFDPDLVRNSDDTCRPANGYHWVNPKEPLDFRVQLMPGLIKTEEGKFRLAKGYRWVNPKDPDDFRVERIP